MDGAPASAPGRPLDERAVPLAVAAIGVFHVAEGFWQLISPSSFFEQIGLYGLENTHYVGDVGSFVLAFGVALVLAAWRPQWRAPLLYLGALWYGFHALNHVIDVDEARSAARGWFDAGLLLLGAALLTWLAGVAARLAERD